MADSEMASSINVLIERTEGLALLQRIFSRRSTLPRNLLAPGSSEDEIRMIVQVASRAPDHQRLKPFRSVSAGKPWLACSRHPSWEATQASAAKVRTRLREGSSRSNPAGRDLRMQESDVVPEIEDHASVGAPWAMCS